MENLICIRCKPSMALLLSDLPQSAVEFYPALDGYFSSAAVWFKMHPPYLWTRCRAFTPNTWKHSGLAAKVTGVRKRGDGRWCWVLNV